MEGLELQSREPQKHATTGSRVTMATKKHLTTIVPRDLALWSCQKEALQATLEYCDYFDNLPLKMERPSMIVCMPTGSGKTAVIGTLARCIPAFNTVVVVSPRVSITDQLYREISGKLFQKLGVDPNEIPKKTIRPKKAFGADLKEKHLDNAVVFLTIQQLHLWHANDSEAFSLLKRNTTLLIFDEGHYEPAPSWSETVRTFPVPRVIFTATPYRNDLRLFAADADRSHFYSFEEAVEDQVIRDVRFRSLDSPRNPRLFVDRLIEMFEEEIGEITSTEDRIIIRCDSLESIHQLKRAVEARGLPCLAVHEGIETTVTDDEYRRVPDPQDVDARVWIHQFKLIEGVDDPRFRLIGIYDGFGSVRSVVQQVGRVTRNPENKASETAFVLDGSGKNNEQAWQNYRRFDSSVRKHGFPAVAPEKNLVSALTEALPEVLYLDRQFRVGLNLEHFHPEKCLQLPCSTLIYHLNTRTMDAGKAERQVRSDLEEADRFVLSSTIADDNSGCVILSVRASNSRLLIDEHFLEPRLAVTVVKRVRGFFCVFDSMGYRPVSCAGMGRRVESNLLRRLLDEESGNTVTGVDLVNSSVSGQSLRGKSLSARSIGDVPGGFDDHAYVTRHAFGFAQPAAYTASIRIRRHLGFSRGRVRDGGSKYVSYAEYLDWLDTVCKRLGSRKAPGVSALDRFASPIDRDLNPHPRSVLLDLHSLDGRYVVNIDESERSREASHDETVSFPRDGDELDIEDLADAVDSSGCFKVCANGVQVKLYIRWDPDRCIYELSSRDLGRLYRPQEANNPNLLEALNQEQSFRVVPREPGVIYAHGEFYAPRIQFGPDQAASQRTLFRCLRQFPCLSGFVSEKGRNGTLGRQAGWESDSLFGLVDSLVQDSLPDECPPVDTELSNLFRDTQLLVCDDMGTELADFILLQEDPQGRRHIIFIHAKAKAPDRRSFVSAAELNDVCGQAIKNLAEMAQYQGTSVDRTDRWNRPWKMKNEDNWTVSNRIRKAPRHPEETDLTAGAQAWALAREYIEDPLCEREVWLLTSNILSYKALQERVTAETSPSLETVQAVYCIYSTMTAAASSNTRLYLICNE